MRKFKLVGFHLAIVSIFFSTTTYGNEIKKYTDLIKKEFSLTNPGEVNINNRYGNVAIEVGTSSKVMFEITISIESKNESTYQDVRDRIDISFSNSSNSVSAVTKIESRSKWNWLKSNNNESYKIDYKVTLPSTVKLVVENKYGDIQLPNMDNDVQLILKYGNGYVQNVKGNLDLNCAYSNRFNLGNVSGKSELEISYSKITGGLFQDIHIDSKYSDVQIDGANVMILNSNYDNYKIGNVVKLENKGKYDKISLKSAQEVNVNNGYARIDIDQLSSTGNFDTKYGSVKISEIPIGFKLISIKSDYTAYELNACCDYTVDFDTKHVDINYPSNIHIRNREKDGNSLKLIGQVGLGKAKIEATMRYGKLILKQQ